MLNLQHVRHPGGLARTPVVEFLKRRAAARRGGGASRRGKRRTKGVIAGTRQAGLERSKIRDALADISPCTGTSGQVQWAEIGRNTRQVLLAEIVDGVPRPR